MKHILLNNVKAPCQDCTDRQLGCHAKCERYAEYRARIDRQNADRAHEMENTLNPAVQKARWNELWKKKRGR